MPRISVFEWYADLCFLLVGSWLGGPVWGPGRLFSHNSAKPLARFLRLVSCMLKPLPAERWNSSTAAHLLNRAGFGGPPAEVEKLAALKPPDAVAQFIDYEAIPVTMEGPDWAKPNPERVEKY